MVEKRPETREGERDRDRERRGRKRKRERERVERREEVGIIDADMCSSLGGSNP